MTPSFPRCAGTLLRLSPLILLLAACAHKAPPAAEAPPPHITAPAAVVAPVVSSASSISGYKTDVAKRVYQTNAERVFTGQPPPLLRSIVVMSVVVDENGDLVSTRIFRDNGDPETRAEAIASLKRAMPLPKPTRAVLRRGQVEYLESWLFRRDGKFQMRTLAEVQASE